MVLVIFGLIYVQKLLMFFARLLRLWQCSGLVNDVKDYCIITDLLSEWLGSQHSLIEPHLIMLLLL